ncbi:ras-related and estrogen-regulated growth inhibitor isoform X5 [Columba livia]|uniref:ras-related and estrogen-regulated growth inhibitor isoform X5 n=1 Tax=Columba livia TaxID=8932 RepID=UPI0031BAEABA
MGAPCFRGRGRGTGRTGDLCARRAAPAGTRPGSRAHPKSRMQAVMNQCLRRNVKYTCRQKAGGAAERLAAGSGACAEQQSCRRRWPGAQPHDALVVRFLTKRFIWEYDPTLVFEIATINAKSLQLSSGTFSEGQYFPDVEQACFLKGVYEEKNAIQKTAW